MQVRGLTYHVTVAGENNLPTIVLLHGFTGSGETWIDIRENLKEEFRIITIDLIGHGLTEAPVTHHRYSMEEQLQDLENIFEQLHLSSFTLLGYSMGGRIALAYTIHYPKRVQALILESSSPGLKTTEERLKRQRADEQLALQIEIEGLEQFVDFWEGIPLFASQRSLSLEKRLALRQQRLLQQPQGLANSLRGIGTGSQPSYWGQLSDIIVPVLLLTGALDSKFVMISREIASKMNNCSYITVEDVGHAIHVENPVEFATIIRGYIPVT